MEGPTEPTENEKEEMLDHLCRIVFNGDHSAEELEDGGGPGELHVPSLQKPRPSMTMEELVRYSKELSVRGGLDRMVQYMEGRVKALDNNELSFEEGMRLLANGDLAAILATLSGFEPFQLCGLSLPSAAEIVGDKKSRVLALHHQPSEGRKRFSLTLSMLKRFARESPATLFLVEMVNKAPKELDDTFGIWSLMFNFGLDIKLTTLNLIFIGKLFFLKHGTPLPVAATTTALSKLDSDLLRSLHRTVNLQPFSHPLRCIITRSLSDWSSFCLLESVPEAVSRRGASKAWIDFKTANPEVANKAQAFASQESAKQQADFRRALGVGSATAAALVSFQQQQQQSKSQGGGSSGGGGGLWKARPE